MKSKHRWYQCYERILFPEKSPVEIYRMYHHMDSLAEYKMEVIPAESISAYTSIGIDPFVHVKEGVYRWDREIATMVRQYGFGYFKHIDIWTKDWNVIDERFGDSMRQNQPRFGKFLFRYLEMTQPNSKKLYVKLVDRVLAMVLKANSIRKSDA